MKNYTYYWRDGKREVLQGRDPADALTQRGYGGGILRALEVARYAARRGIVQ